MSNNSAVVETIRTALRDAADALCRMDAACAARAESLIWEALMLSRDLAAKGNITTDDFPSNELLLCRQMAETASQFWERRRAAMATSAQGTASLIWVG